MQFLSTLSWKCAVEIVIGQVLKGVLGLGWLPQQLTCCYQSSLCVLLSELYFCHLLLHCSIVRAAWWELLSLPSWGLLACRAWTLHLETQNNELYLGYKPLPAYICHRMVSPFDSLRCFCISSTRCRRTFVCYGWGVKRLKKLARDTWLLVLATRRHRKCKEIAFSAATKVWGRRYAATAFRAAPYSIYLHNQRTCIINMPPILVPCGTAVL